MNPNTCLNARFSVNPLLKGFNMKRIITIAFVCLAFSCSPGSQDPDDPTESFRVGEGGADFVCSDDLDCENGFRCQSGACRAIDNDLDNDGYDAVVDCDDTNSAVHPGATEACNNIDDNCNDEIDEGAKNSCGECGEDPIEICDSADNDCDGEIDEECVAGVFAEIEPNDGQNNCQRIALPPENESENRITGAFTPAGDVDSFCFFVRAGTHLVFDLDSVTLGADTDAVLQLLSENGDPLEGGYNDYSDGNDPRLEYVFNDDAEIRLDVSNFYADVGGPEYIYELGIEALRVVTCDDADGDGINICDGDCNDSDPFVFPGQTEVCDGYDNNCDGVSDEECPNFSRVELEPNENTSECELFTLPFTISGAIDPRKDKDVFCFFAPAGIQAAFDIDAQDGGDSLLNSRLRIFSLPEDLIVQNDDGVDPESSYSESDSDSYVEALFNKPGIYAVQVSDESSFAGGSRLTYTLIARALNTVPCDDEDGDGVSICEGDCRDDDPGVHFGANEKCDDIDNDCDGVVDFPECTGDFDGDGFAGADGDCDDNDPTRFPGAEERCDFLDTDCDGEIDEGVLNACGSCGNPPAEICGDNIDNDCDGVVDTDCNEDLDNDGVTPNQGDCDDNDAGARPGLAETCDGADNNCDGIIDEFVKNACGQCADEPVEICDGIDNNCNGIVDDGALNACGECGPLGGEICDGEDNDCDGEIDEGVQNICGGCGEVPVEICDFIDNDCDGTIDEGCDVDSDNDGQTPREGDCDDRNGNRRSGLNESCNDIDDNCNGLVDEGCPGLEETEPNNSQSDCLVVKWPNTVSGVIAQASDSDYFCVDIDVADTELAFDMEARDLGSPLDGAIEIYDEGGLRIAQNNNNTDPDTGRISDDSYLEYTFAEPGRYAIRVRAAAAGASASPQAFYDLELKFVSGCVDLDQDGHLACEGDCNDLSAEINSGAIDVCDSIDNNCSGEADELCVGDCLDDALEQNDTFASAREVALGAIRDLRFCGGDPDYYSATLTSGFTTQVQVIFSHAQTNLSLRIVAPDGTLIQSVNSNTNNESISFSPTMSGLHRIVVEGPVTGEADYEVVITQTP